MSEPNIEPPRQGTFQLHLTKNGLDVYPPYSPNDGFIHLEYYWLEIKVIERSAVAPLEVTEIGYSGDIPSDQHQGIAEQVTKWISSHESSVSDLVEDWEPYVDIPS